MIMHTVAVAYAITAIVSTGAIIIAYAHLLSMICFAMIQIFKSTDTKMQFGLFIASFSINSVLIIWGISS